MMKVNQWCTEKGAGELKKLTTTCVLSHVYCCVVHRKTQTRLIM